ARAVGRSMEPRIHDGDYCIFRAKPEGTRQGKIVLAQYHGAADPETGGAFTVKRYRSEKELTDGSWRHTRLVLEPLNGSFEPVAFGPEDAGSVQIVAEFVGLVRG